MKKCILILVSIIIFMCIPSMVIAKDTCSLDNIKIESIELKDKTDIVIENSPASIDNKKIYLDLKMYEVGDYVEYELRVKNNSNENFYFDEKYLNINSNYFDYSLSYKDNSNRIEPNTEKTIYLKIKYNKEIEKDKFFSGKYKDNNIVRLFLTNKKSILSNPLTSSNKIILLLISMIILGIYLYYKKTNNLRLNTFIMFGLSLLIPISTYALCEVKLDINSNITIGKVKPNPCTYDGELVQGAEYVNGQYTYRYMQENFDYHKWVNISNDGWGVRLTNKESTDDVTTKLCTSINDKPIVSMNSMFFESKASNIDLSSFDTSNVVSMQTMFYYVKNIRNYDLSSFDTSNVSKMGAMFYGNDSLEKINLNTFDISSLENSYTLLAFNRNLKKVNIDNWDFSNKSNITSVIGGMFTASDNIEDISMKNWILPEDFSSVVGCGANSKLSICSEINSLDVTGWDLSKTRNVNYLFNTVNVKELKGLDTWDVTNIEDASNMFYNISSLENISIRDWNAPNLRNAKYMFFNNPSLKKINIKINNTSNLTDISYMFYGNPLLEKVNIDYLDTSNVINMSNMFSGDYSLKKIDLSNFDTSKVTNMNSMFSGDSSLEEVILDGFDLTKSTYGSNIIGSMFSGANNIKNVSMKNWKIPEVFTNALGCRVSSLCSQNLDYIDVTGWDLSKTKNIQGLFGNFYANEIKGLDTFDTSNVENMNNLFFSASNINSLDLSSWNTSKVTNMNTMFANNDNLKTIYVGDKFNTNSVTDSRGMFSNIPLLVGGNGTVYDANHVDKEYARIDEPGKPGYFTRK